MNKKVIYTSIVGWYDELYEPDKVMKDWDYICFSNDYSPRKNSIWQVRPIPFQSKDKIILARFVKLNPHILLKDYNYSLWIDGNVHLKGNYVFSRAHELIEKGELISIPKHPERDCTYKEARACIEMGKGIESIILKQMERLQIEGFPENFGLFENNIVFRNHMHQDIIKFNKAWWEELRANSKRDQLSLGYILWRNKISCTPFFGEGYNVRNHPDILYSKHKRGFFYLLMKRIGYIQNRLNVFRK